MNIAKGNKIYNITEHINKWIVKSASGKLSISFDVSKELCKTEDELREYVLSNEMF